MGRVAFVSQSLAEALKQYQGLRSLHSEENHYEDTPYDEERTNNLELLINIVLGIVDPHDYDIPEYDHDQFQLFWDLVEGIRRERFWQVMVRGPLLSIKVMNSRGLVFVEFKESYFQWLPRTY
ncbi:hypothetical protein D3C78_972020 [compost metagenome]